MRTSTQGVGAHLAQAILQNCPSACASATAIDANPTTKLSLSAQPQSEDRVIVISARPQRVGCQSHSRVSCILPSCSTVVARNASPLAPDKASTCRRAIFIGEGVETSCSDAWVPQRVKAQIHSRESIVFDLGLLFSTPMVHDAFSW